MSDRFQVKEVSSMFGGHVFVVVDMRHGPSGYEKQHYDRHEAESLARRLNWQEEARNAA